MLTSPESLLGQTIEHYRLLEVLGRGGHSTVYLGQHLDDPEVRVAIKVLTLAETATSAERAAFHTRFVREAHAVSQLHHEHILSPLSYGETDDFAYIVMPLMAGGTLDARLALQRGPLPLSESVTYVEQLASALDYAHQRGVAHRDVKPSNILLDEHQTVYLTDFSIAYLFGDSPDALTLVHGQGSAMVTATGVVMGTPPYMAPEHIMGEPAGPATDIYALGVLLYLLVAGQLPFQGSTILATSMKHLYEIPTSPHLLRPELPAPAEAAILCALAKQPADRFASAGALARAFAAGLQGEWTEGLTPHRYDSEQSNASSRPLVLSALLGIPPALSSYANVPTQAYAHLAPHALRRLALVGGLFVLVLIALLAGLSAMTPVTHQQASVHGITLKSAAHASPTPSHGAAISIGWKGNFVYAVRDSDGSLLWRYKTPRKIVAVSSVTGGKVYIYTVTGSIYVLRAIDGKLLWHSHNNGGGDDGGD